MRRLSNLPVLCSLITVPILAGLPQIHFQYPQTQQAAVQAAPDPKAPQTPAQAAPVVAKTPEKLAEKPALAYKALAGQSARYKTVGTLTMEGAGNKVNIEMNEVEKITFTSISPSGEITMERDTESSEQTVNGRKVPTPPDENHKYTVVIKPNGALVSHKADKGDPEQNKFQVRMYAATSAIFTDKPVGIGDKWTHDFVADASTGAHAGHAVYEVTGFEKALDIDAVKIKATFDESGSTPALHSACTYWIERNSGDTVQSDMVVENISFGEGPQGAVGTAKFHQERISGAPMG